LHELNVGGVDEWLNDQIQASRFLYPSFSTVTMGQ